MPLAIWEAGTAYIDLALACYVALSAYALTRCVETGRRTWLVLAALLMGTALAVKHLALLSFAAVWVAGVEDPHLLGADRGAAPWIQKSL